MRGSRVKSFSVNRIPGAPRAAGRGRSGAAERIGAWGAVGPRRARGQLVALAEVVPWDARRPFVDVSSACAIGRINLSEAGAARDRSGSWGGGFVAGPGMAFEVGRYAGSPAVTAICRDGYVWQISAYGDVNGAGAVCFPIGPFAERVAKLVRLAACTLARSGYDGRIVVRVRIVDAEKSCIMTMPGPRFWRELPRTGAAGHPLNDPFCGRPRHVKEAIGEHSRLAQEPVDRIYGAYALHGRIVRDGGDPL